MDLVKQGLIEYLFSRYYQLECEEYSDIGYEEMMQIDRYLGYLGVEVFEVEGNKIIAELEDGRKLICSY